MDVIMDSMIIAKTIYVFITHCVFAQYWYTQDAVTSLAISKATPIANMDWGSPLKIAINPTIEKYAATADTDNAENSSPINNTIILLSPKLESTPRVQTLISNPFSILYVTCHSGNLGLSFVAIDIGIPVSLHSYVGHTLLWFLFLIGLPTP
jgi:hypothetical protein